MELHLRPEAWKLELGVDLVMQVANVGQGNLDVLRSMATMLMGSGLLVAGWSFLLGCLEHGSGMKTTGVGIQEADGRHFNVCWEVVLRCSRFSSAG